MFLRYLQLHLYGEWLACYDASHPNAEGYRVACLLDDSPCNSNIHPYGKGGTVPSVVSRALLGTRLAFRLHSSALGWWCGWREGPPTIYQADMVEVGQAALITPHCRHNKHFQSGSPYYYMNPCKQIPHQAYVLSQKKSGCAERRQMVQEWWAAALKYGRMIYKFIWLVKDGWGGESC